jgi:ABC-type multidrug transport system fused ATPase/permease subunit
VLKKIKGNNSNLFAIVFAAQDTLTKKEQLKLYAVSGIQFLLSILDLVSLGSIGLLASITISGVARKEANSTSTKLLELAQISQFSLHKQVAIIGCVSALLILIRTFASLTTMSRVFRFLSNSGARLSSNLMRKLVYSDSAALKKYTSQEYVYLSTFGVESLYLRILAPLVTLIADVVLLIGFAVALFVVDPISAAATLIILVLVNSILNLIQNRKIQHYGQVSTKFEIKSREKMIESIKSIREIRTRNRQEYVINQYEQDRNAIANATAFNNWTAYSNKYIIESTLIIGGMSIAAIEFWLTDAITAISSLAVFLASSLRMAPAALRIQQSLLQARVCSKPARQLLELLDYFADKNIKPEELESNQSSHICEFVPQISIVNLNVKYEDSTFEIKDLSLNIGAGEFVGIVGESGSGKSTLVDAILGNLQITSGKVEISGMKPSFTFIRYPGSVSYLPQETFISNGSVKENLSFGYDQNQFTNEEYEEALSRAEILDFVNSLPNGLDTELGENGARLSGGQKQRIGLARALITKPRMIILDEATSALDPETESKISTTIQNLGNEITRLVITHRTSTLVGANRILEMNAGTIRELRAE